ncbi:MAG TPA: response regulator [Aquabacterium sp.]|nr:response regulator [Aquabacterium sp.]
MKRILIVEDQADIRELIVMTLELDAYEIHQAPEGTQGLAMARALRPDLVLLDVMMPGSLDGIEVCRQLKADTNTAAIKVIILSAKGQDQDRLQGKMAGADDYLTKPFSPGQLLEVVHRQLT